MNQLDRAYFQAQLRSDPLQAAETILTDRYAALGIAQPKPVRRDRSLAAAAAQQTINTLRAEFWQLPLEQLHRELAEIDVAAFPELLTVVERLQRATAARSEFPKAAEVLKKNLRLFNFLRQSIALGPRDVAGIKETISREINQVGTGKQHRKAAKLIREQFPLIDAIEPGWTEEILRMRIGSGRIFLRQFDLPVPSWLIIILLLAAVRGCRELTQ